MCPISNLQLNLQFPEDLVTFTEDIFNEKLHFFAVPFVVGIH